MADEVLIRFSTRGAEEAAASVDKLRQSASQLGPAVEKSAAQSNDAQAEVTRWYAAEKEAADAARAASAAAAGEQTKAAAAASGASTAADRAGQSADKAAGRASRGISGLATGVRQIAQVSPAAGAVADVLDGLAASSLPAAGGVAAVGAAAEGEAVAAGAAAGATGLLSAAMGGLPLILSVGAAAFALWSNRSHGSKDDVDELTEAIIRDTEALNDNADAMSKNTFAYYTKELRDLVPEMNAAGITFSQLVEAFQAGAAGDTGPFDRMMEQAMAAGPAADDLVDKLFTLARQYGLDSTEAAAFAQAGGILTTSLQDSTTAAERGADALSQYSTAISDALDAAGALDNLGAEQQKLVEMLKDDGSEEYAKRQRDAAKAQSDVTRATEAREAAERKLADVNRRNLDDERERAAIERDRANMSVEQAKVALAEAELHQQRVGAAGGSEKATSEADRAVRESRLKVREATKSATDAEAKYNDVASGAQLERDRAAAVQAVADARLAEQSATAKLGKALADAKVPASQLGATSKEIADQLDRVVRAGVAAGQSLIPMLDTMAARYPQIADAVERIESAIKAAIYGPGNPFEGVDYYASGGQLTVGRFVVGERGPEVLDMYGNGSGYVYPNHHPLTRSILGRADGGSVGSPGSVRSGGSSSVHVVEVGKTTREGDFTGPIIAQGLTLDEVRREARRDGRRRANSRVSRGR